MAIWDGFIDIFKNAQGTSFKPNLTGTGGSPVMTGAKNVPSSPSTTTLQQGAVNPNNFQIDPNAGYTRDGVLGTQTGGSDDGGGSGGTGGAGGTGAAAGPLKSDILGAINNVNSVYNRLFDAIDVAVNDQRRVIEEGAARNTNQIYGEAVDIKGGLNRRYAARGLGDSSFRASGLGEVDRQAEGLAADENRQRKALLAQLGQTQATERAAFEGDQQSLVPWAERINEITEPAELQEALDFIQGRLAELTTQEAGYGTESDFIQQLDAIAPANILQSNLSVLLNDPSATAAKKAQIARGAIANSGLPQAEQDSIFADFLAQLGVETEDEEE